MGLDNPDTLYFHAYLRDDAEYVVTGRRGSTADLSFQVLKGDYSPVEVPDSLSAFDDRAIEVAARRLVRVAASARPRRGPGPDYFTLGPGSADAAGPRGVQRLGTERRGTIRIRRADRAGCAPPPARTPRRWPSATRWPARSCCPGCGRSSPSPSGSTWTTGQHDDPAPAHAGRPGHPVLLGRPLRPGRGPGDDRDRARRRPGHRALPGHPARQHVVRLAGLHQPPDQPHRRPGPHRPGRPAAVRDQRARPGRGQLAGAHRAPARIRADPLAAADPGPHAGRRTAGGGGPVRRDRRPAAVLRSRRGCRRRNGGRGSPRARPPSRKGCSANREDVG